MNNRKKHTTLLISIILLAIPVLAFAVVTMLQNKYKKLPVYNSTLNTNKEDKAPHFIQPFNLINQSGKSFSDAAVVSATQLYSSKHLSST